MVFPPKAREKISACNPKQAVFSMDGNLVISTHFSGSDFCKTVKNCLFRGSGWSWCWRGHPGGWLSIPWYHRYHCIGWVHLHLSIQPKKSPPKFSTMATASGVPILNPGFIQTWFQFVLLVSLALLECNHNHGFYTENRYVLCLLPVFHGWVGKVRYKVQPLNCLVSSWSYHGNLKLPYFLDGLFATPDIQ